ncbi:MULTISPECIES: alpha/beta fold hydrolase [Streptomyces]|uniref:Alpha/beta hydrolase n=1 Tax=Streptomyces chilikensis TaxID=1194079 RepID=A0ABV3EW57_9ACTN|nr:MULTISPECIES: alpha/beta hydrolase [Streptomyces]MDH6223817.1 proline iminopeptidase [Streptomyces sp. MJP52]
MSAPSAVLAPGGPGLGGDTLAGLPLPPGCRRLVAESDCGGGDDPFALQTDRLLRLLGAAGAEGPVLLVAHSAGVRSALRAAAQSPARLTGVVLISAQLRDGTDHPELLERRLDALEDPLRETARRARATAPEQAPADDAALRDLLIADLALTLPGLGPAQWDFLAACSRTWNLHAVRALLSGRLPEDDLAEPAGRIGAPVLVVNGEQDPWAGAPSARELARAVPDGTVRLVPGAGHVPWLDDPETVGRLLAGMAEETTPT